MDIRLYTAAQNSAGERVRIALNLKGRSFEYVPISSTKTKSYSQLNPQALMPTLEVDGFHITQSLPAIEFINEQFPDPPLLPVDPVLKAQSRSFAAAICAELHALTVKRVRRYLSNKMSVDDGLVAQWYADWTSSTLGALEQALQARKQATIYCFADFPTIADITLVPQLANARRFNCDLSSFPIMAEIDARCVALPAFSLARAENQIDYKPPL